MYIQNNDIQSATCKVVKIIGGVFLVRFCSDRYGSDGYIVYVFLISPDGEIRQFTGGNPESDDSYSFSVVPCEIEQNDLPVFQLIPDCDLEIKHITFFGNDYKSGHGLESLRTNGIFPLGKLIKPNHKNIVETLLSVQI